MSSFWENNKDSFKSAGKATARGIGHGTKSLTKAGVNTYKKNEAKRKGQTFESSEDMQSAPVSSIPVRSMTKEELLAMPLPPKRNVGAFEAPKRGELLKYGTGVPTQVQPAPQNPQNYPTYQSNANPPVYQETQGVQIPLQASSLNQYIPPPQPASQQTLNYQQPGQVTPANLPANDAIAQPSVVTTLVNPNLGGSQPSSRLPPSLPSRNVVPPPEFSAAINAPPAILATQEQPQRAVPQTPQYTQPAQLHPDVLEQQPEPKYIPKPAPDASHFAPPPVRRDRDSFVTPNRSAKSASAVPAPAHSPSHTTNPAQQNTTRAPVKFTDIDINAIGPPPTTPRPGGAPVALPPRHSTISQQPPHVAVSPQVSGSAGNAGPKKPAKPPKPPKPGKSESLQSPPVAPDRAGPPPPLPTRTLARESPPPAYDAATTVSPAPNFAAQIASLRTGNSEVPPMPSRPTPTPTPTPPRESSSVRQLTDSLPATKTVADQFDMAPKTKPPKPEKPGKPPKPDKPVKPDLIENSQLLAPENDKPDLSSAFQSELALVFARSATLKHSELSAAQIAAPGQLINSATENMITPGTVTQPTLNPITAPKPGPKPGPKLGPKPGPKPLLKPKSSLMKVIAPKPSIQTRLNELTALEVATTITGPPELIPSSNEQRTPTPSRVLTASASPPPPPPPRNYSRAAVPLPLVNPVPPELDLELSTGWYHGNQITLPRSLLGLNYSTAYSSTSLGPISNYTRELTVRMKDLSKVKYRIRWTNSDYASATVEIAEFLASPIETRIPSSATLREMSQTYGSHLASWCTHRMGTQVGSGECWDLAKEGLEKGCGKQAFVSTYYHHGFPILSIEGGPQGMSIISGPRDEIRPGDILQFTRSKFVDPIKGSTQTAGDPNHTSVVVDKNEDDISVVEQNVQNVKIVRTGLYNLSKIVEGLVVVYRPMPASWAE